MSSQQTKQKCQLSPKCPPKCPLPGPRAPGPCLPPRGPPASSCCVSTCCISGFGGRCSLVSHRFPRFYLRQPRRSDCPENESPGSSSCCHSSGNCSWPALNRCSSSPSLPPSPPEVVAWVMGSFGPPGIGSAPRPRTDGERQPFSSALLCQYAEIKLVYDGTFSFLVFIDFPSVTCVDLHWFPNQTPQWSSQAGNFLPDRSRAWAVGRVVWGTDLEGRCWRIFPEHKQPNTPKATVPLLQVPASLSSPPARGTFCYPDSR